MNLDKKYFAPNGFRIAAVLAHAAYQTLIALWMKISFIVLGSNGDLFTLVALIISGLTMLFTYARIVVAVKKGWVS